LIGGLDEDLKMVFDLDMFLKLSRIGNVKFVDQTLAYYRWHDETLSSKNQRVSFSEGFTVRYRNADALNKVVVVVMNPFIVLVVLIVKKYYVVRKNNGLTNSKKHVELF
jgi:hypothetical protein